MSNTYILLSRSLLDSEVFASQKLLKIWIWCLMKANYKDRFISLKIGRGERTIKVERGQFLFGRHKAEEELVIDGSTIYKLMKHLEKIGNITIKSNNQYSIVTICNYNTYQNPDSYKVATNEQPSNNQVTTKEQPKNTPKKDNKDKKDNNITENFTNFREVVSLFDNKHYNHKKWVECYDRLIRLDGYTEQRILEIVKEFRMPGNWWHDTGNFETLLKLRKKSDGVKFIDIFNKKTTPIKKTNKITRDMFPQPK